ncbi:MAG: hypothetical protein R3A11_08225 [Bdellovibrionota bacterium]
MMNTVEDNTMFGTLSTRALRISLCGAFLMACQQVPEAGNGNFGQSSYSSGVTCSDGSTSCTVLNYTDINTFLNSIGYTTKSDLENISFYNGLLNECKIRCVDNVDSSCLSGTYPNQTIASTGKCSEYTTGCANQCEQFLGSMLSDENVPVEIPSNYYAVRVEVDFCSDFGQNYLVMEGQTMRFGKVRGDVLPSTGPLGSFLLPTPNDIGHGLHCKGVNNGNTRGNAPIRFYPMHTTSVTVLDGSGASKSVSILPMTQKSQNMIAKNYRNPGETSFGLREFADVSPLNHVVWVAQDIEDLGDVEVSGVLKRAIKHMEVYDNGLMQSGHSLALEWWQWLPKGKQTLSFMVFIPPYPDNTGVL